MFIESIKHIVNTILTIDANFHFRKIIYTEKNENEKVETLFEPLLAVSKN